MAALAAVGVAGGVAIGVALRPSVALIEEATPLPAQSPSIPIDPPPQIVPDPDVPPPLGTDLETRDVTVGGRAFGVSVPVPQGWLRSDIGAAESQWTIPGDFDHGYKIRVEMVTSERATIAGILAERSEDLDGILDFTILEQTSDTLVFTYVDESRHRRLQLVRWLDLRNPDAAEVEIALTGRLRDEAGLRALLEAVTEGAREP